MAFELLRTKLNFLSPTKSLLEQKRSKVELEIQELLHRRRKWESDPTDWGSWWDSDMANSLRRLSNRSHNLLKAILIVQQRSAPEPKPDSPQ
ncbi:MAG: hypothetical protein KGI73_00460 [Patescibacteria group bacterium]|nr:hypothetical protein [Patescibacteria group bacterium]